MKSIRSWIHIHMSYDLTLLLIHSNTFFRKFASSSPPIRRKTNSVPTNIPLNVIPIMLKSFFMGVFFLKQSWLPRPGAGGRGGGAQLREITLTHTCTCTCSQTCEEKNTFILTNKKWIFLNACAYRSKSNEADKFVILQASLCLQAYFYCLSYN